MSRTVKVAKLNSFKRYSYIFEPISAGHMFVNLYVIEIYSA